MTDASQSVAATVVQAEAAKYLKLVLKYMRDLQQFEPKEYSEFAADDRYLSHFGSSFGVLVVHRLLSVFDHLQLCLYSLARLPHPLPFSQLSLARSALAGASTSLWVVDPDSIELRRVRALRLAFYDTEQYAVFADTSVREDQDLRNPERISELMTLQASITQAHELRQVIYAELCRLYKLLGKTKMPDIKGIGRINEVSIVGEASRTLHQLGRMTSSVHVELQYRLLSGIVHNCYWASEAGSRATSDGHVDLGDYVRETTKIEGNAQNVLNAAKTAVAIGELAIKRYGELSVRPAELD